MGQHLLTTTMAMGEITPLAAHRQDSELYAKSLAKLKNFFVLKHGGVRRRSGTRYRGPVKYHDKITRLMTYTYSVGQSYALELGDLYMRVWLPAGQVLNVGGSAPYELAMPYTEQQVRQIQSAPYNDVVYLAHPAHHPRELRRITSNSWTLTNVDFVDGPYLPINDVKTRTVNVSTSPTDGGTSTLTWSAGSVALSAGLDIGRHVRVSLGGNWSWGKITAVSSALVATVLWVDGNGGTAGLTTAWRLGAFFVGNYPGCVSFFEDRAVWSGVPATPRAIYASYSGLPANFTPSSSTGVVTAANSVAFELSRSDPILWLKESSRLLLGTATGIRSIGGTNGAVMTPTNVTQRLDVRYGMASVVPEQVGTNTVVVGRAGRLLRRTYYDYQVEGLVAPDMSVLSEHMFKRRILDISYQETPESILWAVDFDGGLYSATMEDVTDTNGFAAHDTAGGAVKSICALSPEERDDLWLIVSRTINSQSKQYVETLEKPYDEELTLPADAFCVDCGLTYSGAAVNTISGLAHLEGRTVQLLANGARLPDVVVTGGAITLPNGATATKVQIGLGYDSRLTTLEAPAQANDGSTLGRRKKAVSAVVKTLSTQGLAVGTPGGQGELFVYRNAAALLGTALPLNTGTYKAKIDDAFEYQAQIELSVTGPFPATVLALNIDVESEP